MTTASLTFHEPSPGSRLTLTSRWIKQTDVQPTPSDYPIWATRMGDKHAVLFSAPDRVNVFYTHWQRAHVPTPPQPPTPEQIAEAACVDAYRAQSMDFAEAAPSYDWREGWRAALIWVANRRVTAFGASAPGPQEASQ